MTPLQADEIRKMERAGRLAGELLRYMGSHVKVGVTTNELDRIAHDWIMSKEALPAPLGYHGFPKSICTSVNEVICHGVPDDRPLKDGDIINVDVTCIKDGFFGDTSATFFVGEVTDLAKRITQVAKDAMMRGIDEVRPFATTGDIGFEINKLTTKKGFHTVKEIGGHGIGKKFHDEPFVPSYGKKGRGMKLKPWCCITVEPMINATAAPLVELSIPGSTIKYYVTGDKTLSAQFEHTVMITDKGHEILTLVD
ncbi:MAG: type I methionyl aminopeptidase [Bdellovibrionales bacterium]